MMITPFPKEEKWYPIRAVTADSHYVYPMRINDHYPWDLSGSRLCDNDCDCDEDYWENEYGHPLSKKTREN